MNKKQLDRIRNDKGFIAALDQSGGSTPKALNIYGITSDAYTSEKEMFNLVHEMRTRIITSPSFDGEKVLAAILFKTTMERKVKDKDTADYLWKEKRVVPFLKIDNGLTDEKNGIQLMKPVPDLDELLARASEKHIFGTKMRSVIHDMNEDGIQSIVDQQFTIAKQIIAKGLVPIIEPEVNINAEKKAEIEDILEKKILSHLDQLSSDELIMLKLTIPEKDNLYKNLAKHKNVVRVVALSGGYSREEANKRLAKNKNMTASFSRALVEGLYADQTQDEFDTTLQNSIESIYHASTVKE